MKDTFDVIAETAIVTIECGVAAGMLGIALAGSKLSDLFAQGGVKLVRMAGDKAMRSAWLGDEAKSRVENVMETINNVAP